MRPVNSPLQAILTTIAAVWITSCTATRPVVPESHNGRRADIEVPLTDEVVWIAAQELITPAIIATWNEAIGAASIVKLRVLGLSGAGVPIRILDSNPESRETIILIGRQHPPEVSGSIAFFAFVETLLVRDLLNELDASDSQVRPFLDFHSTRHNLFYTQTIR